MKTSNKVKGWLVRGEAAAKGTKDAAKGGISKDLADALKDDPSNQSTDDTKPVKKAKAKSKEKEAEDDDDGDDDDKKGGLVKAFSKVIGAVDDKEDEEDDDEEGKEEDDDDDDADGVASSKYKDIDKEEIPSNVSSAVSEKMKKFKSTAVNAVKDLKTVEQTVASLNKKIKELEKGGKSTDDIDKNPVVVDLRKKLEEYEGQISQLSIQDSPQFRAKYDEPRVKAMKKLAPVVKSIEKQEDADAIIAAIDSATKIVPGEDADAQFYRMVNRITKMEGFPEDDKEHFKTQMSTIREVWNQRGEAVEDWRKTKKSMEADSVKGVEEYTGRLESAFTITRNAYLKAHPQLARFIEQEEVFGYKAKTEPLLADVSKELQAHAKTGELTPKLLKFINNGVEFEFLSDMTQKMQGLLKDVIAENSKLKKKLGMKEETTDTKGGKGGHSKKDEDETESSGSGLVDTLRRRVNQ